MKLFLVIDHDRWGWSHNVVRAATETDAAKLVGVASWPSDRVEITELSNEGPEALLWSHDESPDTRDRD